jgi:hypothetical protein
MIEYDEGDLMLFSLEPVLSFFPWAKSSGLLSLFPGLIDGPILSLADLN